MFVCVCVRCVMQGEGCLGLGVCVGDADKGAMQVQGEASSIYMYLATGPAVMQKHICPWWLCPLSVT